MSGQAEERRRAPVSVLLVGPSLRILGGQAVQASQILRGFNGDRSIRTGFLPVNPRLPGLLGRLQDIKYVRTVLTSIAYILSLIWTIPRFDVIHIFSASYLSFVLAPTPAILIARLFGKKALLNYRSGEAEDHLSRWASARRTIRLADGIAVPSGYLVDVFAKFGFHATAIHNTVDTSRYVWRKRTPLRPVFLSNRNFERLYRVDVMLRAFALIQQALPGASLTVAGDGAEREALLGLARELKLRNVEFVGRVPQERMHELYDAADIYLNTSEIDNMPVSIIEAYASGTPVVTTNPGGIPYILRHESLGLLVACGDHEGLAREALRLIADPALASSIADRARAQCANYEWPAVRGQWLDFYRSLAGGG